MTPAPCEYKPDRFIKYDLDTKLQPHRANIPNDPRFKVSGDDLLRGELPGPGQYTDVIATHRRNPSHGVGRADRKLLKIEKTMGPSPMSYDTVTGLSMCSSAAGMPLFAQ